jgi:hypothetical protein
MCSGHIRFEANRTFAPEITPLTDRLRPNAILGDAQPIENLFEMNAAHSADHRIGIDDRFGGQERTLEAFDGADIGLRGPGANRNADTDTGEEQLVTGVILPCCTRSPIVALPDITTSTVSPLAMRLLISLGGASIRATLCSQWSAPKFHWPPP